MWPATDKLRFAYRYLGIGATVRGLHAVAGGAARGRPSWTDSDESWSDLMRQQCMAARRAVIALQSRVSVYSDLLGGTLSGYELTRCEHGELLLRSGPRESSASPRTTSQHRLLGDGSGGRRGRRSGQRRASAEQDQLGGHPAGAVHVTRPHARHATVKASWALLQIMQVQKLIERCLELYMSQQEIVTALKMQANIEPGLTNLGG